MTNDLSSSSAHPLEPPARPRMSDRDVSRWRRDLLGGGTAGNERLTTLTGLLLIVLLAALGITIVRIGQLLWLHLFLGLVLLGPVVLKLASTGYRFVRYYTSNPAYVRNGPPAPALRALAPLVVLFTLGVFVSGVALLVLGPSSRGTLVLVHKLFFFAWAAVTALHVAGHLPAILRLMGSARRTRREIVALRTPRAARGVPPAGAVAGPQLPGAQLPGAHGRGGALAIALACGLGLAGALLGQFAAWTH
jgi:hypothetical protein